MSSFDCLDYKLLIGKLFWYGVSPSSPNSQGLILGPLLYNIDLIDLFSECDNSEISSYADDTTPYYCADDILA